MQPRQPMHRDKPIAKPSCKYFPTFHYETIFVDMPSVVAMVSMAFGILGIAACLYCKDVDDKMNNKVSPLYHTLDHLLA